MAYFLMSPPRSISHTPIVRGCVIADVEFECAGGVTQRPGVRLWITADREVVLKRNGARLRSLPRQLKAAIANGTPDARMEDLG
jgi:hypothetical protein